MEPISGPFGGHPWLTPCPGLEMALEIGPRVGRDGWVWVGGGSAAAGDGSVSLLVWGFFPLFWVGVLLTGEVGQEQANGFPVIGLMMGAAGHSCRAIAQGP